MVLPLFCIDLLPGLVVDTLQCSKISFLNVTTRLVCFVQDKINGENFLIRKMSIPSHDSSSHSTNGGSFPDASEPLVP